VLVIPAIDIRGGKVVRLTRGDPGEATVYGDDPVAVAEQFLADGARMIHVVDLDAALGEGTNRRIIRDICRRVHVPVQTGGGLRTMSAIGGALSSGAARAVLGTSAVLDQDVVKEAVATLGEKIVVALDVSRDKIMVNGWKEEAGLLEDLLPALTQIGVARFLITSIAADGTMNGPDFGLYRRALKLTNRPVLASGGVRNPADLGALADAGVEGAIVGKAIYEGGVKLREVADL